MAKDALQLACDFLARTDIHVQEDACPASVSSWRRSRKCSECSRAKTNEQLFPIVAKCWRLYFEQQAEASDEG